MPHVSSADDAKETIAAEMTKGTIKGVIDQMKIEAMREGQVYAKRQREAFDILATPLGQFGPGGPDSGAGAGRPSTAADYLKKIGHQ